MFSMEVDIAADRAEVEGSARTQSISTEVERNGLTAEVESATEIAEDKRFAPEESRPAIIESNISSEAEHIDFSEEVEIASQSAEVESLTQADVGAVQSSIDLYDLQDLMQEYNTSNVVEINEHDLQIIMQGNQFEPTPDIIAIPVNCVSDYMLSRDDQTSTTIAAPVSDSAEKDTKHYQFYRQ